MAASNDDQEWLKGIFSNLCQQQVNAKLVQSTIEYLVSKLAEATKGFHEIDGGGLEEFFMEELFTTVRLLRAEKDSHSTRLILEGFLNHPQISANIRILELINK